MNVAWSLSGLILGLVGGIATLVVLAVRAALDGLTGLTFGDLWTAVAVGVSVGVVAVVLPRVVDWQMRRATERGAEARWVTSSRLEFREPEEVIYRRHEDDTGGMDRFDRFTETARRVLTLAQDEAQRFNHSYVGTEHLLLGLIRERDGLGAHVLEGIGVDVGKVRTAVEFIIGRGDRPVVGEVGLTASAKRSIELAIDEARRLGHRGIGTEHVLLGLVAQGDGIAAGVLASLGVDLERTRAEVIRVVERGDRER